MTPSMQALAWRRAVSLGMSVAEIAADIAGEEGRDVRVVEREVRAGVVRCAN